MPAPRAQAGAPLALCLLAMALADLTCPGGPEACQAEHEDVGLLQSLRQSARAAVGGRAPPAEPEPDGSSASNPCAGTMPTDPAFDRFPCFSDGVVQALEQAGGNITEGFVGGMDVGGRKPWNQTFAEGGLCPVNVHWHLGTEHLSMGEFDESGSGPAAGHEGDNESVRLGFQCHLYDESDPKFTTPYDWKYCDPSMQVGQTYEVHWPHSAAGDCGTPYQYQTPFLDGVFCNAATVQLSPLQDKVGVHGQVFVIVNDEDYYYPDMMKGMIVEPSSGLGSDIAYYTGSTTGTTVNNEMCSAYSPITWQVDRKCHLISASSFDKLCADMMSQADDMSADLHAHGSRELVAAPLQANNMES
ncbi:unnamed protein product [Prorocentrum cordatum]|uniref:Uncharacterized protein n=1 Tax=Prorocentrum cordatum TaxID=2364126 RepID=A0ABN9PQ77_9DINO|nr:unnamed protein product [Polarella glacialis]